MPIVLELAARNQLFERLTLFRRIAVEIFTKFSMELRAIFTMYISCVMLANTQENIHAMKHICARELPQTFRKYSCIYNQPSSTDPPTKRYEGLVRECCDNQCSEYYLITTYCKNSTIHSMPRRPLVQNGIQKDDNDNLLNQITQNKEDDEEVIKDEITNNMLVKGKPKEHRTYKPPVVVLSKISSNPPIPIQRKF
ncbi:hypothetical protein QE152_g36885 [Popillia japonica]|uniref:Insulin-like domain-containing protein n=1 Tax=Popillia japonica TaxID=7064 RepID=A0AAW1IBA4_POPJA